MLARAVWAAGQKDNKALLINFFRGQRQGESKQNGRVEKVLA